MTQGVPGVMASPSTSSSPSSTNDVADQGTPQGNGKGKGKGKSEKPKVCAGCAKSFTFRRRRHSCGRCRGTYCDECSSTRVVLPVSGEESRVCSTCLDALRAEHPDLQAIPKSKSFARRQAALPAHPKPRAPPTEKEESPGGEVVDEGDPEEELGPQPMDVEEDDSSQSSCAEDVAEVCEADEALASELSSLRVKYTELQLEAKDLSERTQQAEMALSTTLCDAERHRQSAQALQDQVVALRQQSAQDRAALGDAVAEANRVRAQLYASEVKDRRRRRHAKETEEPTAKAALEDRRRAFENGQHHSTRCYLCSTAYSFFNREHHCRTCFNSVCQACSNVKKDSLRHCDLCLVSKVIMTSNFVRVARAFPATWSHRLRMAADLLPDDFDESNTDSPPPRHDGVATSTTSHSSVVSEPLFFTRSPSLRSAAVLRGKRMQRHKSLDNLS
eukprot:Sspe_Gene.8682::Locus_2936_Transcript_1_1_Confidence_1.000_Length_1924::g.8682::m.8682